MCWCRLLFVKSLAEVSSAYPRSWLEGWEWGCWGPSSFIYSLTISPQGLILSLPWLEVFVDAPLGMICAAEIVVGVSSSDKAQADP